MAFNRGANKNAFEMQCQRCNGPMAFEKFYGQNTFFYGWHCVLCGEILDPVILLHRLSHDADIPIPKSEEEIMSLIKKYMSTKPKPDLRAKEDKPKTISLWEDYSNGDRKQSH